MAFGVYGIFFPGNYVYVGSTIASFDTRHRVHLKALKDGKHDNNMMQDLYNKYHGAIEFRTLEECSDKAMVRELEQYYMEQLPKDGYILCNETPALVEGNPLGDVVKEKISQGRRSGKGGRKKITSYSPEEPIVVQKGPDEYHKKLYQMREEQGW